MAVQCSLCPTCGVPSRLRNVLFLLASSISGVSTRAEANLVGTVPAKQHT